MPKKQTKKMVPYSEVQDEVAAKRGRDLSEARAEQVDEIVELLNQMPGHAKVKNPLRGKAKSGKRGRK
jgi:hypothetical protein